MKRSEYLFPLIMVTSLFFMWGFVHNLDPILIPHLKKSFSLNNLESSLVDSAVFIAYLLMALPAGLLMRRYGYKAGIIVGLVLFALGSFLFIPAADTGKYGFFLGALFVIACGLTILETAANPYVTLLGEPSGASRRLNFAQAFNGLAATLAPLIGARLILTKDFPPEQLNAMTESARTAALAAEAATVKGPYLVLGLIILAIAVVFYFLRLPEIDDSSQSANRSIADALSHRHLRWAVVAQFFYVGAQISVFSFFIIYAVDAASINKVAAADYLGLGCGLAFMSGRFIGSFLMKYVAAPNLLAAYALLCLLLCLPVIFIGDLAGVFSLIGITFFMSIMFPTIFSLGISFLGADTKLGSSLIVMAIVGGAVLPPAFGFVSDLTGDIRFGHFVTLICFVVILIFAVTGYKPKVGTS